ncbi:MAG: response regulator [Lachnospiraceae bacterium]|nr:response regulator [Lachnospiraceae bacterium]
MYKVVVIDDEKLVRQGIVLEIDWKNMGCSVVGEAGSGREGLEVIRRIHPDLVVCDIRMPDMDGIEMLRVLREEDKNDVPIVFLTAFSDFKYTQQAIRYGANDYLLKPFHDGDLEQAVLAIIGRAEGIQQEAKEEMEESVLSSKALGSAGKSKYVVEALDYIAGHYGEQNLRLRDIAEALHMSEGHLSHVFKKETDYTVNNYITRFRMRAAMKLLKDCRMKVYEVAEEVGYKDLAYFSTTFKNIIGCTPSEYQDRSR